MYGCFLEEFLYGGEDCEDLRDRELIDECNGELVVDLMVFFLLLVMLLLWNIDLIESMDWVFNISGFILFILC